jgi:single-stranded-DNA-specific exonuclease
LLAELDRLKPTGQGNPPVQFWARQLANARPPQRMGAEKQHAKLWVSDGKVTCEAIWWGVGTSTMPEGKFDLAFVPQVNDFSGRRTVQLKMLDWRAA